MQPCAAVLPRGSQQTYCNKENGGIDSGGQPEIIPNFAMSAGQESDAHCDESEDGDAGACLTVKPLHLLTLHREIPIDHRPGNLGLLGL